MREIELTQGKVTLVDDEDFDWLNQWSWFAEEGENNKWYAARKGERPVRKHIYMHRLITNAPNDKKVDHCDNNGLNNQRHNLRLCTNGQNGANKGKQSNNTTGFKGVFPHESGRIRAQITVSRKSIHLGYFSTPEEAARAYDRAAREYFGEFARLNFPEEE